MVVLIEVLEPLIEVAMLEPNFKHVHSFDIDFPIKKHLRRLLDSTCINIMHSFASLCCKRHTLFIWKMSSPSKSFLSFGEDEMLQDPTISFLLTSYAEAQALALESLVLPPSQIVYQGYDLGIIIYINDEALEDV
jgi:hypothetical protein